jgi:hypothetical protein
LGQLIGLSIPQDAWWAMDYHFDWLIGALHLYEGGEQNKPIEKYRNLIQGTQEDMDLVIAFDKTLILIEAKGVTSWGNGQLNDKVDRLEKLEKHELMSGLEFFRFILMSPRQSEGIKRQENVEWPIWMLNKERKPLWLKLQMGDFPSENGFLKVVRCNEHGKDDKDGKSWVIK